MTHPEYFQSKPKGTEAELKEFAKDSIQHFFDTYDLDESQDLLWQIVKQSFYSTSSTLSAQTRENLMSYYENLHQMILCASILHNGRVSQRVWSTQ